MRRCGATRGDTARFSRQNGYNVWTAGWRNRIYVWACVYVCLCTCVGEYAEASQKIIRILTCRRSQETFGFAPRHAERIKLFTLDTYTKSIVEVNAIDKMNDGYMAPSVPPPLADTINRLLQNRSFSMWHGYALCVPPFFVSPFWVIMQAWRSPRSNRAGSTVLGERWFVNKLAREKKTFSFLSLFLSLYLSLTHTNY